MFLGTPGAAWIFREWAADRIAGRLMVMRLNLCSFESWLGFDPEPVLDLAPCGPGEATAESCESWIRSYRNLRATLERLIEALQTPN